MAKTQLYILKRKEKWSRTIPGAEHLIPWYHVVVCFNINRDQEKFAKLLKGKTLEEVENAFTDKGGR